MPLILIADNDDLTVELEPESWPTDKVADPDSDLDNVWIQFQSELNNTNKKLSKIELCLHYLLTKVKII